jgi:hypothetical protein
VAERWFAVIKKATGEAVSFGTVLPDVLPDDLEAVPIDHQPGEGEGWNAATRSIVKLPPPPPPPEREALIASLDSQAALYALLPQVLAQLTSALQAVVSALAAQTQDATLKGQLQTQAGDLASLQTTLTSQGQELATRVQRLNEAKARLLR